MINDKLTPLTLDENTSLVADLSKATPSFCSLQPSTQEEKVTLFNAMNNPTFRLDEKINCTITVKDIYAETVEIVNEKTGEVAIAPRIILIDTDGNSYGCCSYGIFNSIKKLIQVFGAPTWNEGISVIPVSIPSKRIQNGRVLSLKLA